jgi:Zn-finger nucleic acid-binding protein
MDKIGKRGERMSESKFRVVLDTADPQNECFRAYLDGAGIAARGLGKSGNYVSVEYVGARRALEAMIEKHWGTGVPEEDRAMVDSIEPVGARMSAEDRAKFVELLQEESGHMHGDLDDSLETVLEYELNGVRGLAELSDEELLAEADSTYLEGAELSNPPDGGCWDPTEDELFRLWAKCRMPGVLCPDCGGSGEVKVKVAFGCNLDDCPKCGGSGLSSLVLPPKYVVVRNRRVFERVELRAATPQEAAEKAKESCAWTGQSDEQLTLKVFAEPNFDTDEPLYQE